MLFIVAIEGNTICFQAVSHLSLRLCDRFQLVYPVTHLIHFQPSLKGEFFFLLWTVYSFYGPVCFSQLRHFSTFNTASLIWKLPNMLPIFLLLPAPFFLFPIFIWTECRWTRASPPPPLPHSQLYIPYQRLGLIHSSSFTYGLDLLNNHSINMTWESAVPMQQPKHKR